MGVGAVVVVAMHAGGQGAELGVHGLYEGVGGAILAINLHGDALATGVAHGVGEVTTGKSTGYTKTSGGNNAAGATTQHLAKAGAQNATGYGANVLGGGRGLTLHLVGGDNGCGQHLLGDANLVGGNGAIARIPSAGGKPQRYSNEKKCGLVHNLVNEVQILRKNGAMRHRPSAYRFMLLFLIAGVKQKTSNC